MRIAFAAVLLASCALRAEHRDARDKYNEGVQALVKEDFDGAEQAFLAARSEAGVDPELRFRAAFDLGATYAAHAEKLRAGQDEDLDKALELEEQAVSWFSDAVRQNKDDTDAAANLATVRARAQAIADDLRKGKNKLENRLDTVIGEQRGVLEASRDAWRAVKETTGADPLAQKDVLSHLADRERGIVAEAGTIGDLAADEIDEIGKKKEEQRKPEEKIRLVQLKNLDLYLVEARSRIAEARRKLQDLDAEEAGVRAEAAVVALKRAREQLSDPIEVMQHLVQDEIALDGETREAMPKGLDDKKTVAAWLSPAALAGRQGGLRDRLEEVRQRFAGAADAKPPEEKDPKKAAEQAKMLEHVVAALPHMTEASSAMERAKGELAANHHDDARKDEEIALRELAAAIEEFAELRQLCDLAYETSQQTVGLLSPEAAAQLPAAERGERVKSDVATNVARVARIKGMIAEELAKVPPENSGSGSGSGSDQKAEQAREMFTLAEQYRAQAEESLAKAQAALDKGEDPTADAKAADEKLDQLRKLFFNIVEHLKALIQEQGNTRDQTSAAAGEDEATRAPKLPDLKAREDKHDAMGKAIGDALAKQADDAAKQAATGKQGSAPSTGPDSKALAGASDEVRQAVTSLDEADKGLGEPKDLKPVVDAQGKALEHLEAALKLLEPPPQKKNDQNQDKKQDQQKQDQQKQDQQKQQQQQQQRGGAGQRARDQDAQRQRERQQRGSGADQVEKDW